MYGVFCFSLSINSGFNYEKPIGNKTEGELPRVSPSEQVGLKHILVAVDAVPVSIRYAWKQRCFKCCFFMTQLLKISYHFKSVSGGICVSPLVYVFQYLGGLIGECAD